MAGHRYLYLCDEWVALELLRASSPERVAVMLGCSTDELLAEVHGDYLAYGLWLDRMKAQG